MSSRSRVHSLPSLDFPSLLFLLFLLHRIPRVARRLVHFGLVGNILTISFSYRYPVLLQSKNYTSRLCSWYTGTTINCLPFLSRDINHRGNKIFLLTRRRERDAESFDTDDIETTTFFFPVISCNDKTRAYFRRSMKPSFLSSHLELPFQCSRVSLAIYVAANE